MLRLFAFSAVLCCLGTVWGAEAWADAKRMVVLTRVGSGMSSAQADWMGRTLRRSLRKQSRFNVLKDAPVQKLLVERVIPPETPGRIAQIKQLLQRAQKLYRIRRFPMPTRCRFVLKAMSKVDELLTQVQTYIEEPDLMREIYLYRALAYFGLKDKERAREYTLQLVQHAPSYTPTESAIPSSFMNYHSSLVNWVNGRPKFSMVVGSAPSGAKVYHNFRYVGTTPYTISNMVSGKHSIRLVKTAFEVWERVANLTPEKLGSRRTIKAKIPLKQDHNALVVTGIPLYDKDATFSDDILDRLDKINARLGSEYLFVTEPKLLQEGAQLTIAVYRKGSRKILYDRIKLGTTPSSYRSAIHRYAKRLLGQIRSGALRRRKK